MQTKCPNCETVFRLTDEQLSAAHGKVRCGLCHNIFTASSIDQEPSPPVVFPKHDEDDSPSTEVTDAIAKEVLHASNEILLDDIETNPVIPDEFRNLSEQTRNTQFASLLWSISIVILLGTLISEYAWFNRNQLAKNSDIEPWISQFCETTGCKLEPLHKPDLIEMVNRNVYSHPNIKKALMITATMINKAPHAQAYPDVEIGFSNVRGKIVTQRIFTPEEYMKMDQAQLRLLQPDTPTTFGLEIQDPGKQAMAYEFNFL